VRASQFETSSVVFGLILCISIARLLLKQETAATWAGPHVRRLHERLQEMIRRYELKGEFKAELGTIETSLTEQSDSHEFAFAGFALLSKCNLASEAWLRSQL